MRDKSFVTLVTNFCPICGGEFQTDELLMDTRVVNGKLVDSFDRTTCTGVDLCPDHMEKVESGEFVMFFVCEERDCAKCEQRYKCRHNLSIKRRCNDWHSKTPDGQTYLRRTGDGFMMKKEIADKMFNCPIAPINHCEKDLLDKVRSMMQPEEGESHE